MAGRVESAGPGASLSDPLGLEGVAQEQLGVEEAALRLGDGIATETRVFLEDSAAGESSVGFSLADPLGLAGVATQTSLPACPLSGVCCERDLKCWEGSKNPVVSSN